MSKIVGMNETMSVDKVGGKAFALAQLSSFGFRLPAFFVIPSEAFENDKQRPELKESIAKLGAGPFAVRSSGRQEDGAENSFAGQFDTKLNVATKDVWKAACEVFQSGFSETVETYRALKKGGAAEGPAVIVQCMIDATAAGVAFSADPVSGRRDCVVISAIDGLGERLVSGEEDGEDWKIGLIVEAPTSPKVLNETQARAIADLAKRAEKSFGCPQDIEWAIDKDGLHILQSRPITTTLLPAPQTDNALTIFDNSNIVESYPGMVSPLTYSFAVQVYDRVYRSFVSILGVNKTVVAQNAPIFGNMLARVDGRVYYNLGNWYRALALLPGFSLNRGYMETMMGVSEPLPAEITDAIGPKNASGFARIKEYLKLVRVGFGLLWQAIWLPRTMAKFYDRLNAALHSDFDIETAGPTALVGQYRKVESTLLDRWDAPLINDFLCMMAFGASRNLMEKWLGQDGLQLHNDVMIGQGDIVSAEPAQRIATMGKMVEEAGLAAALVENGAAALEGHPDIQAEFQSYLDKFGDRCVAELKLESIPLTQDPSSLIFAIASCAGRAERSHRGAVAPDWKALFPKNPIKRIVAKRAVTWAKNLVRNRENLRFERTRIFGYARSIFLAIGREFAARGLLDTPRDVFYLTTHEVLGAVEGFGLSGDLRSIVALRKAEDAASLKREDPPERIEVRGPAIAPIWTPATLEKDNSVQRTATGCSAGKVEGIARVIRDPKTQSLASGEILIARHTDPGWIAVLSNASAIVVERGSLLSHSAIVARELGIPCVVGLKGATHWIADGERIIVDGATGEVERCDAKI